VDGGEGLRGGGRGIKNKSEKKERFKGIWVHKSRI
jgi:hypothetical protein